MVRRILRDPCRRMPAGEFICDYLLNRQIGDLAASVAFHALLYLFPFLGAVTTIAGLVLGDERRSGATREALLRLFPDRDWQEEIGGLIAARAQVGLLGLVSIVGLLWLGSTFIASLTRAFNALYDAPPRSAFGQRLIALAMIAVFAALLLVSILASGEASLVLARQLVPAGAALLRWDRRLFATLLMSCISFLTTYALFVALYWLLPNVRQPLHEVGRGALLGAALLTIATQAFPLYLRIAPSGRYGKLFSLIVLFTIWLYLLAHILLLGAGLNAYRYRRHAGRDPAASTRRPR